MDSLQTITAAELVAMDLGPETPEEAYRRGYFDAAQTLTYRVPVSDDAFQQLEKWLQTLCDWKKADCSQAVLPPRLIVLIDEAEEGDE